MNYTTKDLAERWLALEETNQEGELLIQIGKVEKVMSEFETAWHEWTRFEYFRDEANDLGNIAAFDAWTEYQGEAYASEFDENFRGEWEDVEEYAGSLLDDMGILDEVPPEIRPYFSVSEFARDLELSGDVWTIESQYGVFVFQN